MLTILLSRKGLSKVLGKMESKKARANQYWSQNLVCPACKGAIKIIDSVMQCQSCHRNFPIIDGVPCFVSNTLDEHQRAELESNFVDAIFKKNSSKTEKSIDFNSKMVRRKNR